MNPIKLGLVAMSLLVMTACGTGADEQPPEVVAQSSEALSSEPVPLPQTTVQAAPTWPPGPNECSLRQMVCRWFQSDLDCLIAYAECLKRPPVKA